MPRYIVKLTDADRDYYLEWSTVVDSPVTWGLTREEFKEYYRDQYGRQGMFDYDQRMQRVDAKGTSSRIHDSAEDVVSFNRAGKNETDFSVEQIIEWYCRRCEEPTEEGALSDPED